MQDLVAVTHTVGAQQEVPFFGTPGFGPLAPGVSDPIGADAVLMVGAQIVLACPQICVVYPSNSGGTAGAYYSGKSRHLAHVVRA